jgi:hypothetical protein
MLVQQAISDVAVRVLDHTGEVGASRKVRRRHMISERLREVLAWRSRAWLSRRRGQVGDCGRRKRVQSCTTWPPTSFVKPVLSRTTESMVYRWCLVFQSGEKPLIFPIFGPLGHPRVDYRDCRLPLQGNVCRTAHTFQDLRETRPREVAGSLRRPSLCKPERGGAPRHHGPSRLLPPRYGTSPQGLRRR